MSAPEIVRMAGIVEIAVAEEDVRAAAVVVVVVGAVVAAAGVVTAVGMVATAAAEGIKPRIAIYEKSKSPPHRLRSGQACRTKHDKGGASGDGELRLGRGSFLLGRICAGKKEMLWASSVAAKRSIFRLLRSM